MVFSSLIFLFVFLPIFLAGYYLLPSKWRNLFIVLGGYFFYSWGAPKFALVLFLTIIADYCISVVMTKLSPSRKKGLLIVSIVMNLGLLVYFKYANFFVEQINWMAAYWQWPTMPWREVVLPIGISFTVFQELSYIIEVYRGKIKPAKTVVDFAAYLMLFPHLIAGPIVRYIDIAGQLKERLYSVDGFAYGVKRFSIGLAKKVLIANPMSTVADAMFYLNKVRDLESPLAWLGIVAYALQIYFDFSGYSDMAIGLAKMLGFDFLENFNRPYTARSITDFWRRWHMSLTTWMREYIYIPLGGNRVSTARMYLNLWAVFLISGLWHGASWNFVLWGAVHGCLLVGERLFGSRWLKKIPIALQVAWTFFLVNLAWVLFRIEDLSLVAKFYRRLFSVGDWFRAIDIRRFEIIDVKGMVIFGLALVIIFVPWHKVRARLTPYFVAWSSWKLSAIKTMIIMALLLVSVMELFNAQFNPFIYFRF